MSKKISKTKSKTVKKSKVTNSSNFHGLEHDFVVIVGGGFLLIVMLLLMVSR